MECPEWSQSFLNQGMRCYGIRKYDAGEILESQSFLNQGISSDSITRRRPVFYRS